MKTLFAICILALFSTAVYVSLPESELSSTSDTGVCVTEFNAGFNKSNSVDWLDQLNDCKGRRIDIAAEPAMQKEHRIVVVPTIIVFNNGEEVKRFQANILMQLEATQDEVQEAIDEIIMSAF
jgi:predicted nucleotidyltransferase